MAWRPSRMDLFAMGVLALLALALKVPIFHAPPYGDEGLFFSGAAQPGQMPAGISQVDGRPIFYPTSLVWERPAFYAFFWLPAQFGFEAFRTSHAVVASLLAPLGFALVRAHGGRRTAATGAGLAVATVPLLVVWGTFSLTDSMMTLWLGASLLARRQDKPLLAGVLLLVAIWTKETAYAAALMLFGLDLWRARWEAGAEAGRLWPIRLDARLSSIAWPLAIGLFPFLYAVAKGFPSPAPSDMPFQLGIVDALFLSAWMLPLLALGLWLPRSRFLSGAGLAAGGFLLALHLGAHFSVQSWYQVPAVFFAIVGVAAAADAVIEPYSQVSTARHALRFLPAVLAVILVAGLVLVPAGQGRAFLRPLGGDAGNSLVDTYTYETTIRDRSRLEAYAALPLDGQHDLVIMDLFHAHLYGLAPQTHHIWYDASFFRSLLPLRTEPLAQRIEANGTWTLVAKESTSANLAVREVYADCLIMENADYAVYRGWLCPGRATMLEASASAVERGN